VSLLSGMLKAGIALLGYLAAVTAAAVTTVALLVAPTMLPDDGALGSFYAYTRELPVVLYGAFVITFPTAFPGFLVTLGLAAAFRWRAWLLFAAAGCIDVLPSILIFNVYMGTSMPAWNMATCFPGGFVGGFVYWAVAGRFLAKVRDGLGATSPEPSGS
jgi:hypothetical protein